MKPSALALALLLGLGCSQSPAEPPAAAARPGVACAPIAGSHGPRPNIVLVTICSLRHSHVSGSGYPRNTTPHLDAWVQKSLAFDDMIAASSWTKPAAASILTGLTPNVHGLTDYYSASDVLSGTVTPKRVLSDQTVTLAECLRDGGYQTFGRVNNVHAGEFYRLDQGFDDYSSLREQDTGSMLRAFEGWLAKRPAPSQPFFFFLLSKDVHSPYQPSYASYLRFNRLDTAISESEFPEHSRVLWQELNHRVRRGDPIEPALRLHLVDLYDAALADQDRSLARLADILEGAGVSDQTIVVVTADHGERFFEGGEVGHGHFLDAATLHVPLWIKGAGIAPGHSGELARSIDLFPTLVARAGLTAPQTLSGRDLLARSTPPAAEAGPEGAFASFKEREHMVRYGVFNLYRRPGGEEALFATRDPAHVEKPLPASAAAAAPVRGVLDQWLALEKAQRALRVEAPARAVPGDVQDDLRALGYLQ